MEKWYEDNYNNNGASPQNVENQKWLQDLGQVLYETKLRDEYNAGYNEQVPTQSDYYPDYPSVQEMADQQPPLVTMPTQPVQPMTTDSVVHSELTEQAGFYSPQQPIDNYNAPPFGYQPDNSNFEYHNPVLDANQQLPAVTTYSQYQDQHVPNEPIHQIQYQQEQAHQPEFDYWSNQVKH